eukprot:TRINITY_DN49274_c0_g1_i1.p1 TRINITY_DN49274_c0_g1~~TRINITY_DN49274_c0_g1_i1.p1  ORF type:complete len:416 (-),score=93.34 TRINITY_DN49274_c0_g1_i1:24-1226(-)
MCGERRMADQLFASDASDHADFYACINSSQDETMASPSEDFEVTVTTFSGADMKFAPVTQATKLAELKQLIAHEVAAPSVALKLLAGATLLEGDNRTLGELGISKECSEAIHLVRCALDRQQCVELFRALVSAFQRRDSGEARRLVDQGAGFDDQGNLLKAATRMRYPGDWTTAEEEPGNTMLHMAIREGMPALALYLINKGVDINACNDYGRSPLMQALLRKQADVVQALMHSGPDLCIRDQTGSDALDYALRGGWDNVASEMLRSGAFSAKEVDRAFGRLACSPYVPSALMKCAVCRLPLTAEEILKVGVESVNAVDMHGRSALHYAFAQDLPELVAALLARGADVRKRDRCGWLPEECAQLSSAMDLDCSPEPLETNLSSGAHRCVLTRALVRMLGA